MKTLVENQTRKAEYSVNEIFLNRWSPRAMSGEEINDAELMTLFEAAKWAPSSGNNQPWRFLYAKRNTEHWEMFVSFLVEGNKVWAKNGAALVVVVSKNMLDYNGKPAKTHSYDTGAAWGSLALQGSLSGLVVHGMQGFDYDKAKNLLEIPDDYTVEAMAVIGKHGKKEDLPPALQERESPSGRKKLSEIAFEGKFVRSDAAKI